MEKTKIFILATAVAVLAAAILVSVAFAQTSAPTQVPTTGVPATPNGGSYGAYGYGYCPGINGYANGAPQNGYPAQPGYVYQQGYAGRCGGMMGAYYR